MSNPRSIDPRTPVIIGVGQYLHRADDLDAALEPAALMERATRAAIDDAGLDALASVDSVRVVGLLSWKYPDPARVVADRLGWSPRETAVTTMGGNSPQSLVNATSKQILAGELDVVVLTGGEASRSRNKARKAGVDLDWTPLPDPAPTPVVLGSVLEMNMQAEIDRGVYYPVQVYPMFETAIRAASGATPEEHLVRVSEMWARFSAVAADNPHAWIRDARSAEELRTPGPDNRMNGLPYPKTMNSNNDVDMGATVVMCSAEAAERLAVPRDRWVFPHSGADCHEHPFVSNRDTFARTPAIELGGRRALELAGVGIDDIAVIDLYSCFPSAVQLGARSLGLDPYDAGRQLTRTGGLAFAGGPWNNYVMHAIATVVQDLRAQPEELGLVWANGGYATKHAFGVYGTQPPAEGFRHAYPQDEIDALPRRELALPGEAAGPATIEAYTVMHDRDGAPELAISTCLLADGRRAWGLSQAGEVTEALCTGEWVGVEVTLSEAGDLLLG